MIYQVKIEKIELRAAHGCYDLEKKIGGNFTVDIVLDIEDSGAVGADDVAQTVNYIEVYDIIREQMSIPSNIIENAAMRMIDAVYACFPQVRRVEVTLSKLAPPIGGKAANVSVTLVK